MKNSLVTKIELVALLEYIALLGLPEKYTQNLRRTVRDAAYDGGGALEECRAIIDGILKQPKGAALWAHALATAVRK